jgi:hypothetical protein
LAEIKQKIRTGIFTQDIAGEASRRGVLRGLVAGFAVGLVFVLGPLRHAWITSSSPGKLFESQFRSAAIGFLAVAVGFLGVACLFALAGGILGFLHASIVRPVLTAIFRSPEEFEKQYGTHSAFLPRRGGATPGRGKHGDKVRPAPDSEVKTWPNT